MGGGVVAKVVTAHTYRHEWPGNSASGFRPSVHPGAIG